MPGPTTGSSTRPARAFIFLLRSRRTAGCNLGCRFCQNWDISKARELDLLTEHGSPAQIAAAALQARCHSVAFTYNDPVIFAEYAIDTANACHDVGLKAVAVTAGYITPEAREPFFAAMDAANIDLKAFSDDFYHRLCFAELQPVLADQYARRVAQNPRGSFGK